MRGCGTLDLRRPSWEKPVRYSRIRSVLDVQNFVGKVGNNARRLERGIVSRLTLISCLEGIYIICWTILNLLSSTKNSFFLTNDYYEQVTY